MNPVLAYVLGLVTVPALGAVVVAYACGADTGMEIECRACGYSTGPMRETRRFTCWHRWHWHKLTTGHHTRRWMRRQDQAGAS